MAINFLGLVTGLISRMAPRSRGVRVLNDYHRFDDLLSDDYAPGVSEFLQIPAVFSAVMQISQTVGSLPLHLYAQHDGTKGGKADSHPAARSIKWPNRSMSRMQLVEFLMYDAIVHGAGYARVHRDANGLPTGVVRIPNGMVDVEYSADLDEDLYTIRDEMGHIIEVVPDSSMVVFRGFAGMSLADACSESLVLTQAAERYAIANLRNGCRPGGILTHPGKLSPDGKQRLRASWEKMHGGPENAFRVAVLEDGMQFTPVSGTASDAELSAIRDQQVLEVARIFNIPPTKLRVMAAGGYSIEQEGLQFLSDTIRPWLVRIEAELNRKMLDPVERDRFYFEFSVEGMLRSDILSRFKSYSVGRNWSILTANECRRLEGLPPMEGGDALMSPVNMTPLSPDGGAAGARAPAADPTTVNLDSEDFGIPQDGADTGAQVHAPATSAGGTDVAATALNGAQISSLVDLVAQVGQGLIPAASAKAIALASFPFLDPSVISGIFDPVKILPQPAAQPAQEPAQ